MNNLKFIDSLDEEQAENAVKVARMAREAGVDPVLAVAIAFKEGSLRTNTPRGKSGEIGMMQVMPKTGLGLGYDEKKLSNPNQNIKAGVQYLKQGLQAAENSPELAAIYYNGGPGAVEALKAGKEPDPRVFDYVRMLNGYGTFGSAQATESAPAETATSGGELQLVEAPPPPPRSMDTSGAAPSDRLVMGGVGAAIGTGISGASALSQNRDSAAVRRAAAEESARIRVRRDEANARTALLREQQAAQRLAGMQAPAPGSIPTPGQAPGTPPGGLTGGSGPSQQSVRIQQGATGDLGTTGRARSTFNDETSKLSASQKLAYNNADILKNMGLVEQGAPEYFAKQPGMTSSPTGVLYPRSEPAPTTGARQPQPFQTRTGPKASLGIPPVPSTAGVPATPPPIPSVLAGAVPDDLSLRPPAPPKSGLAAVGDMFTSMMKPLEPAANAAGRALRPLLGPLGGISAGLDVAEIAHEMNKPADQRSLGKIFLKGASAGTGALSMIPGPQQRITVPAALGSSALYEMMYNEELKNYMRNKLGMEPQVTP
jgi:hypothetical protein